MTRFANLIEEARSAAQSLVRPLHGLAERGTRRREEASAVTATPAPDGEPDSERSNYPSAVKVSGYNRTVVELLGSTECRKIAEIGVYKGGTSREIAKWLDGKGELHLFDFHDAVDNVVKALASEGYSNVRGYGNSYKHLDSYNWSLAKILEANPEPIYDFVYIDGAHTWAIDGFTTLLVDRLLVVGGYLAHDDYNWSLAISPSLNPDVFPLTAKLYTQEQIRTKQVKMICDLLIRRSGRYEEVVKDQVWRKVRDC